MKVDITGMPLGTHNDGRRAGAFFSVLACAGALKAPVQQRNIKALYVTSSFPKDTMPIDVMVEHQLKTLGGPNVELRAVVFDNTPPWLSDADLIAWPKTFEMQRRGLEKLHKGKVSAKLPRVTVKPMDYEAVDDPAFLAPFFHVDAMDKTGAVLAQKSLRSMFGTTGEHAQMLSNFFAMTHFMRECMSPENDDVDLCLYFDPDMLMYGNTTGILELATATFEDNPELVVVSPPFGCYRDRWVKKDPVSGACPSRSAIVSSRHVIAQRRRLVPKMPITVPSIGKSYWEGVMTEALGRAGRGQILCGQEFFIVHPPSRYQKNKRNQTMPLMQLLRLLVPPEAAMCSEPGACSAEVQATLGTKELVRRFEAGRIVADKQTLYNKGCGCCADMMPSAERIGERPSSSRAGRPGSPRGSGARPTTHRSTGW
ncbi:unnamed protein product [Prorocentrum cordatum]|uniref:Uncharacterized protein n=1 Tax=Prorocentrum cordatum TaxID=2364126 RepID=A0ABN9T1P9_9DINO|nr:unnamed protein product [Polarella glacialis]